MPKKNPKRKPEQVPAARMGWEKSVQGNYNALKVAFQNQVILTQKTNFLIDVLEKKGLVKKVDKEIDGAVESVYVVTDD
jgi:hypothetical protein